MTEPNPWRPTGRRLTEALFTALTPIAACSVALAVLTTWVGAGKAGSPARISVTAGRVFLPYGDTTQTAAFFDITNVGGADDRLIGVTSSAAPQEMTLGRHSSAGDGAAYKADLKAATVPAGGELNMSPHGLDVTLRAGAGWRAGDLVPFTLYFEHSGPVETEAVVMRPSGSGW
ncbi:copper chaperone PCu(A)C [Streptomyces sp. NPDC054794]